MEGFRAWERDVLFVIALVLLVMPRASAVENRSRAALLGVTPQETNFTLEGTITQREPGKLTVSTEENIIFHVVYGEKTEIKRKDGSQGSDKDLAKGVKIKVEGDLAESGEITARKIEVE